MEYTARAACYAIIPSATPSISVSHIAYDITFAPLAVMTLHPTTSFVRQLMHAPIPRPLSVDICIYRVIPLSVPLTYMVVHSLSIALCNGLTPYQCTHLNSLHFTHISTSTVVISQSYIIFIPTFSCIFFFSFVTLWSVWDAATVADGHGPG